MGLRQRKRLLRRRKAAEARARVAGRRRRVAVTGAAFSGVVGLVGGSLTVPAEAGNVTTKVGVELVGEAVPGARGVATPGNLVAWQDSVLFTGAGSDGEVQLWRGDSGGVEPVFEEPPFDASTISHGSLRAVDDKFYFAAARADAPNTEALWVSDGTDAGTSALAQHDEGTSPGDDAFQVVGDVGGTLFFGAVDGRDTSLWSTDGTVEGTTEIADLKPGPEYLRPSGAVGDRVFFRGWNYSDDGYPSLWVTDGTATGTQELVHAPGYDNGVDHETVVRNTLYFTTNADGKGHELWCSDGTKKGTKQVVDLVPGKRGSEPTALTKAGGTLVFVAHDAKDKQKVWRSDGTKKGTKALRALASKHQIRHEATAALGKVGVFVTTQGKVSQLWRTNATKAGTKPLTAFTKHDVAGGFGGVADDEPVVADGLVWFGARTKAHGFELWTSDGTKAGTGLVKDLNPGKAGSNPMTVSGGDRAWFLANDGRRGRELWRSQPSVPGSVVRAPAKQKQPKKVSKKVRLTVRAGASEAVTATFKGKVKIKGGKSFSLATTTTRVAAGKAPRTRLRLVKGDRAVLKALRKFRKKGKPPVNGKVTVVLRGDDGATTKRVVRIRLT